tara:strand:- start:57 stop:338 length:282 start_codon:yes stop_codon:yes gene_type:complete
MKRTLTNALKARDIEETLWELAEESMKEIDVARNCKIGNGNLVGVLKQLSAFEMLRRKRDFKDTDHAQERESMELREWMQQVESSGDKAKKTL